MWKNKLSIRFCYLFNGCTVSNIITANVLALGEEADFEALNCLPAQNLSADGHKASFSH